MLLDLIIDKWLDAQAESQISSFIGRHSSQFSSIRAVLVFRGLHSINIFPPILPNIRHIQIYLPVDESSNSVISFGSLLAPKLESLRIHSPSHRFDWSGSIQSDSSFPILTNMVIRASEASFLSHYLPRLSPLTNIRLLCLK